MEVKPKIKVSGIKGFLENEGKKTPSSMSELDRRQKVIHPMKLKNLSDEELTAESRRNALDGPGADNPSGYLDRTIYKESLDNEAKRRYKYPQGSLGIKIKSKSMLKAK